MNNVSKQATVGTLLDLPLGLNQLSFGSLGIVKMLYWPCKKGNLSASIISQAPRSPSTSVIVGFYGVLILMPRTSLSRGSVIGPVLLGGVFVARNLSI